MVSDHGQELSNRVSLRAGSGLAGFPFHSTRDGHRNFHPRRPRDLGDATWFGAVCHGDGTSIAFIMQTRTAVLAITAMALAAAMAERRRADTVIEEQKSAVEAANQTKDNFLAMLSHELRTPLTPVIAALGGAQIGAAGDE